MIKNDRFIRAISHQSLDTTPVWMMRQSGRYLPEYKKLRSQVTDFMSFCKNPDLTTQATLLPFERFPSLDAAIIFSDILTVPDAMGQKVDFVPNEGPKLSERIQTLADIESLNIPDPEVELSYVMSAIRNVKPQLDVPLIGFSGSPWTIASYMVEGQSSKTFSKIKAMLYSEPKVLKRLLETLTTVISNYLNAQIEAGVDAIMIFDTWGGVLTKYAYEQYSLFYMSEIIRNLRHERDGVKIPVILFTKNGNQWLESISESGCDMVSIDWTMNVSSARRKIGEKVALQGNMDPAVLYADADTIRAEVKRIIKSFGPDSGHVFNLGHGIYPDIPPENVAIMIDAVHEYGRRIRQSNQA